MKRQEQIKEMAQSNAKRMTCDKDMQVAFADALRRGAEWSDAHPHWISVEDELPKDGAYVVTINKVGLKEVRHFYHGKWFSNFGNEYGDVTHWMPLPELPKKESEK